MADTAEKKHDVCALCGQPVQLDGFTLTTNKGREKFCCAGCLSIYQLINIPEENPRNLLSNPEEKPS
jgi:hypothetical protein